MLNISHNPVASMMRPCAEGASETISALMVFILSGIDNSTVCFVRNYLGSLMACQGRFVVVVEKGEECLV